METSGDLVINLSNLKEIYHIKGLSHKAKNAAVLECALEIYTANVKDKIGMREIAASVNIPVSEVFAIIGLCKFFDCDIEAIREYMNGYGDSSYALTTYIKQARGYYSKERNPKYDTCKTDYDLAMTAIRKLRAECVIQGESSEAARRVRDIQAFLSATVPIIELSQDKELDAFLSVCDCTVCGAQPLADIPHEIYKVHNNGAVIRYPVCKVCSDKNDHTPKWQYISKAYRMMAARYYSTLRLYLMNNVDPEVFLYEVT